MKFSYFFKFIISTLKDNPRLAAKIILSLVFLSATQASLIFFVKGFLDSFFIADQHTLYIDTLGLLPQKIGVYVKMFLPAWNFTVERQLAVFFIPLLIALAACLRAFTLLFYSVSQREFSAILTHNARTMIFSKILGQNYLSIAKKSPASWMSVVMNDVNFLQDKVTDFLTVFLRGFFLIISSFIALYFLQPLTAYCLLISGIGLVAIGAKVGKKIAFYADFFQAQIAKMSAHILNIRERFAFIKAQHGEHFEMKKLNELITHYYLVMRKSIVIRAAFAPTLEFLGFFLLALFIWLQQKNYFYDTINADNILPFFVALGLVFKPLKDIGKQFTKLKETLGALKHFEQILEAQPLLTTSAIKHTSPDSYDVTFKYDQSTAFCFNAVTLRPGQMVALIGASGAGKSTLIRTLAGLLHSNDLDTAYVSQTPFLFSGTLRENLTYGLSERPADEKILEYLEIFKLTSLISGLAEGLDSRFEALKDRLSGGEKQRLTIVRSILQDKKILLLDEVTAALDAELEIDILKNVKKITSEKNIATLMITHRYENLSLFSAVWTIEDRKLLKVN